MQKKDNNILQFDLKELMFHYVAGIAIKLSNFDWLYDYSWYFVSWYLITTLTSVWMLKKYNGKIYSGMLT